MVGMPNVFKWFGGQAKAFIGREIDKRQLGSARDIVALARKLAPERTSYLRSTIDYTYEQRTHTLHLHADAHYAFFVEYGTRFMVAQPFLRPALLAAGKWWGRSQIHFQEIRSPGTIPMPRANSAAIARNMGINRGLDRKFGWRRKPRVVIQGKIARSLTGYKPPIEGRYG